MRKKTILSYGEILWDILPETMILGGAPFNFAYRINTLGDEGLFVSRLGKDELGEKAFHQVLDLNINPVLLQWDDQFPTGTVQVSFDQHHNPDYVIIPNVAYDHVEMNERFVKAANNADCICFGTLIQRTEKSRHTLENIFSLTPKCIKFYDINLRKDCFSKDIIKSSLNQADILKLNETEAKQLKGILHFSSQSLSGFCEEACERYRLEYCIVTLAEKGAFIVSTNGENVYDPGYKINLADSLGAGDAFSAGFVHKILHGFGLKDACRFGNILGALTATKNGATAVISDEEIHQFSQQKIERVFQPELRKYV